MTTPTSDTPDRILKWAQFALALSALIGAMLYAGQRSERDEQQTKSLERMASDLGKMQEQSMSANAELRVLGERMRQVEERVARIERR